MLSPMFHLLVLGVGVGSNANFSVRAGGNANFSIFRYQHPQNEIVALGVEANARTQSKWFCVAVEYRLDICF